MAANLGVSELTKKLELSNKNPAKGLRKTRIGKNNIKKAAAQAADEATKAEGTLLMNPYLN